MTDPQLKMELIETLKYAERAERLISTIKAQTLMTIIRQIAETSMEFDHCEHSVKFAVLMVKTLGKIAVELEPSLAEVYEKFKRLLDRALAGTIDAADAELFRAQSLTEMATMSVDDGLAMQVHPGSFRNHNPQLFRDYGRDKGADIPTPRDYVHALRPLLGKLGNERNLTVILFTLDETSYSRELAPLAGHYPILKLGPSWWFHDSPEGMLRFREQVTETAGFYNTVVQRRHARVPVDPGAPRRCTAHRLPLPRDAGAGAPDG